MKTAEWILLNERPQHYGDQRQTRTRRGTNVPMNLYLDFWMKEGGNPTIMTIYDWVGKSCIRMPGFPYPTCILH